MTEKVRIDKWLWSVRLFKTRSLSAEACDKGKVRITDQTVKASRTIKIGDVIVVHRGPWLQTVKVVSVIERRIGPALVKDFM
jgi:ribosome-associated heat shock protein Hsp15